MKYLINILISGLVATICAVGVYRYAPVSWLEPMQKAIHGFGSTITTINGSDTLSSSRAVINTNFANLNATKIENSSTTINAITTLSNLGTIGTIISGVWNGTAITGAFGGTSSTTLSINQIMLGNTTNGLKTVSGYGTSGQFLTSNGAGNAPTFTTGALDTSLNYNWTGTNLFKTLVSSTTISFNNAGVGYSLTFPSLQGASTTALENNGSGTLTAIPMSYSLVDGYIGATAATGATSTAYTLQIPANTLKTTNSLSGRAYFNPTNYNFANIGCDVGFGNGSATTSIGYTNLVSNPNIGNVAFNIMATSSTAELTTSASTNTTSSNVAGRNFLSAYNTASILYLDFKCAVDNGGVGQLSNLKVEISR